MSNFEAPMVAYESAKLHALQLRQELLVLNTALTEQLPTLANIFLAFLTLQMIINFNKKTC
jgi:hypothetical protein